MTTASGVSAPPQQRGLFYGWWIVAVSVLLMATIFGTIVNSFSLFAPPIIKEYPAITIAVFGFAYSFITLIGIPIAPVVGNLLKKFDARWVVGAGVVLAALANVALSFTTNVVWLYVMCALQGVALMLSTTIPISSMVTNWFIQHRGLALGIATAGSGLGSLIFVPLINLYLLPNLGWRNAYLALAVIQVVVLLPLALLVLRSTPEAKGLKALGYHQQTAAQKARAERPGLTQAQVLRTPAFWLLGLALIFAGVSVNGMISNFASVLTSLNSPKGVATYILSTVGIWVMISKFLTGWIYDKVKLMLAIGIVSLANAAQFFFMLAPTNEFNGTMFAILHGFGATMVTITPAYLAARLFGDRDYAAVYGWVSVFALGGAGLAPFFTPFFYGGKDTSGFANAQSLVWGWLVMGLIGFAFFIVTVLVKPKWEPEGYVAAGH